MEKIRTAREEMSGLVDTAYDPSNVAGKNRNFQVEYQQAQVLIKSQVEEIQRLNGESFRLRKELRREKEIIDLFLNLGARD